MSLLGGSAYSPGVTSIPPTWAHLEPTSIKALLEPPGRLPRALRITPYDVPVEAALAHLPRLVIADNAVDAVCHGAPLAAPGLLSLETDINKGDMVSFFTLKGEAVAVGVAGMESREMLASQSGIIARTERVIMQPNTYPKAWKLSERDAATAAGNAAKKVNRAEVV